MEPWPFLSHLCEAKCARNLHFFLIVFDLIFDAFESIPKLEKLLLKMHVPFVIRSKKVTF